MKKALLVVSVIVCLFSACTTLQTVSFDRLEAADFNFPERIQSVGVINCMPVVKAEDVHYASGLLEGDGKTATEALAQEVAATHYFDRVVICDSALWQRSVPMEGPLSTAMVDSLAQALEVDLLLVMERVHIQLTNGTMVLPDLMVTVPGIDGVVTPVLRSYLPGREIPLFSVSRSDTLCWQKGPKLTFEQIVKESSEYAATMPIENLLPHWVTEERYYFDGGNVEMRDAGVYLRENNWEGAAILWKQVYDTKKGKPKMRAAYNLALYSEMQSDFQQAIQYLDEASLGVLAESPEGGLILFYRGQLERMLKENQRLRIQMMRFER